MVKRIFSFFLVIVLVAFVASSCNANEGENNAEGGKIDSEVTDLQLALLNKTLYIGSLTEFEGESIEGHSDLVEDKYKNNISGGDTLVDQLKGFRLVDYDYGDITGFEAAAFTKGKSLVIVFGGTDHWTDFVDDAFAGVFDFSAQDGQAKAFAKDNIKKYKDHDLFITGYSMGGRLCYLGTEDAIDNDLGSNLKKVRTFNGLGVKEAIDVTDSNWSNIHNLEVKFADKTYDYIVEGDIVSDKENQDSLMHKVGYNHIGTEFKVPCTNEIDKDALKQHDMYSIIDYLLNHPAPAENASSVKKLDSKPVLVVKEGDHNLNGTFINVDGDTEVNTWNTFVSKYPNVADPMSGGREYFSKIHITLFFLKDNEGNVLDNKGFMNATGFGTDPCDWLGKYGNFDWMYTDTAEIYEDEDFCILYEGEYYEGPAECRVLNAKLREYVTLGDYEQDGNEDNGKEPIEWLVLTQEDDRMLVVSKYGLDYLTYPDDWSSDIVWESCSLRSYLNSDFMDKTFSEEEKKEIILSENENKANPDYYSTVDGNDTEDYVFLLSIDEVQKYLPATTPNVSSKCAYGTEYLYRILKNHQDYGTEKSGDPVSWALRADIDIERNPEKVGMPREVVVGDNKIVVMIKTGGLRDPDGPLDVIRPAMWIKSDIQKHKDS